MDRFIQGTIVLKDFDISKEARGVDRAITKNFIAFVTENHLEIHQFCTGKGTCCIPELGDYGPSISAISVVSNFTPTVIGIPPHTAEEKRTGLIVGVTVPVGVVTFSLIFIFVVFYLRRRKDDDDDDEEELLGIALRPNTFGYAELRAATDDFSPSNKIGEGGSGPVYKCNIATLLNCTVAASKETDTSLFMSILRTKANKSLDQAHFGNKNLHLDWPTCFSICLATARGLVYLHKESRLRIVHRDVKASNILLDSKLCPKVSEFGLAKQYDDQKTHISTRVAGTIGYLAPEYAMCGHLTEKADVFGFGVVALEILSGRPNYDNSQDNDKIYLLEWVKKETLLPFSFFIDTFLRQEIHLYNVSRHGLCMKATRV
ncbi:hypothetical protein SLEP1_g21096 [Rubroshorea leprosula]|uniref:non-specific serine/threonine protein kinase n=1 Tax=Rubroshorea leprosula TaxID=152421 RepID=A0AAV5J4V4_9ROSI|nr:hypothetical protein SLEP1_g21096 [Rubroshorea leprosula]